MSSPHRMMAPSIPPDLSVVCRLLTSIEHSQLPRSVPLLTKHIIRCRNVLSSPQEDKPKGDSSQVALLVHKLRTSLETLLKSRSREARFAAIALIKALIDVGGWETLRTSQPLVAGLLKIIQRGDPLPTKELAIITLTRIFVAVQPFQTLIREIATQNLEEFIKSCLQLIRPSAPGQAPNSPMFVAESVCNAFSTLVRLYPTTFRPFSSQIKLAVRGCLAPTSTDNFLIPRSLTQAARKLVISMHRVAAKSGGSDEWAKQVDLLLRELHSTADQVLRGVVESWEGSCGYTRKEVSSESELTGGQDLNDQLPVWRGLTSGVERLIGLFTFLADCLRYSTCSPVVIPVDALRGAVSRVCDIARLNPRSQSWDKAVKINDLIDRDEREQLWTAIPDIHLSALQLVLILVQRFQHSIIPLVPGLLDDLLRTFKSGIANPDSRLLGYKLLGDLLLLVGPTMSKATVDAIETAVTACCRDLQENAGLLQSMPEPSRTSENTKRANSVSNADLFLKPHAPVRHVTVPISEEHRHAAEDLLTTLLSRLPQQHLKRGLRHLLDQTAVLTGNREAMGASVLNPYKGPGGRVYPSILPYLAQQYPDDQIVEVMRSNLRTTSAPGISDMSVVFKEDEPEIASEEERSHAELVETERSPQQAVFTAAQSDTTVNLSTQDGFDVKTSTTPFPYRVSDFEAEPMSKRKHEGFEDMPAKRPHTQLTPPAHPTPDITMGDDQPTPPVHPTPEVTVGEDQPTPLEHPTPEITANEDDDNSDSEESLMIEVEDLNEDDDEV